MTSAVAWAVGGGALVVVGLAVAVAVLGIQLGRARAAQAGTAAALAASGEREQRLVEERGRVLAQLEDERARAEKQFADLRRDIQACERAAVENLPPEVLRARFRDLLSTWGAS